MGRKLDGLDFSPDLKIGVILVSFKQSGNKPLLKEILINLQIGSKRTQATDLNILTGMRLLGTLVQFKPEIIFKHSSGHNGLKNSELDNGGGMKSRGDVALFGV